MSKTYLLDTSRIVMEARKDCPECSGMGYVNGNDCASCTKYAEEKMRELNNLSQRYLRASADQVRS